MWRKNLACAPCRTRVERRALGGSARGVETALRWLERYNTGFILSFRFIYGVRNISSFAMGMSAVRWQRFLCLNFLAAGLWAASFVAAGYFLGHAFRAVLGHLVRSFSL